MTVRPATIEDLPHIINMAADMHTESRYRTTTFVPGRLGQIAASLMHNPDGFAYVAEQDGELIGCMLAQIMREPWFSLEAVAYEYGVYVKPEHRGTSAGGRMVKAFKEWAVERGAMLIDLGISTGITEDRTGAFYERLGFKRVGSVYSMEV